jgi:hypothetical protein
MHAAIAGISIRAAACYVYHDLPAGFARSRVKLHSSSLELE